MKNVGYFAENLIPMSRETLGYHFWTVFWFESIYLRWFANRSKVFVCLRVAVSLTCITFGFLLPHFFLMVDATSLTA
jgi:hypothetical protein